MNKNGKNDRKPMTASETWMQMTESQQVVRDMANAMNKVMIEPLTEYMMHLMNEVFGRYYSNYPFVYGV